MRESFCWYLIIPHYMLFRFITTGDIKKKQSISFVHCKCLFSPNVVNFIGSFLVTYSDVVSLGVIFLITRQKGPA